MRPKRLSLAGVLSPKPARGLKLCSVGSPDGGESNNALQFTAAEYLKNQLPVVPPSGNIHPLSTLDRDFRDPRTGCRCERLAEGQHAICGRNPVRDRDAGVQAQDLLQVIMAALIPSAS
jgi:hypothetical protein